MSAPEKYSRIVIENVYPEIDGGRYPAKRVVGDHLDIWADIFSDGHDLLNAVVVCHPPGKKMPMTVALKHVDNDRWGGAITLNAVGTHRLTLMAWTDDFGSWRRDTRRKIDANQNVDLEMQEGRDFLDRLLTVKVTPEPTLLKTCRTLVKKKDITTLNEHLLSEELRELYTQYGPRDDIVTYPLNIAVDRKRAEFSAWYEMFPRSQGTDPRKSGTFADCINRLDDIRAMGFDVVYLPPIHPIGKAFRKGKNNGLNAAPHEPGSPYAIGSEDGGHKAIHPELGTLKDFQQFVAEVKKRSMEVALDFAVQVSPDHPYIKEHPEWFSFRGDGSLKYAENPPKKYQDIANFNFASGPALWDELRSIIAFWVEHGVTIFRVDNPHTKPFVFWEWMIASIREEYPDVIFLAEAFTRPKVMYLLAKAGFNQSYTYFTWRTTKTEFTEYLTELTTGAPREFFRPNFFPTTPDIFPPHLHKSGRAGYITRLTLAATLSGNYGIYSGYELCEGSALPGTEEYADSEKYEIKVRDWNIPGNIKDYVTKLNDIRNENIALHDFRNLRFYPADNEQVLFYGKISPDKKNAVFIAVNLDPFNVQEAHIDLPLADININISTVYTLDDLLLGHSWSWTGAHQHLRLDPAKNPVAMFRIQLLHKE